MNIQQVILSSAQIVAQSASFIITLFNIPTNTVYINKTFQSASSSYLRDTRVLINNSINSFEIVRKNNDESI